ncbi:MAG TPA: hypothetical protein PKA64_06165, partial [Myxococcota bacterium]|nr:hypothetical protein [Myxococcota bacterium]
MRPLLALFVALLPSACAAPPERAAGAVDTVDTVDTVEADVALLVRRLSVRHPDADCAAMTAGLGAPGPALRRAVEQA